MIIILTLLLAFTAFKDDKEKRIALVLSVTGSNYHFTTSSFDTPTPDIALTLSKLGFEVIESIEPDRYTMMSKIRQFAKEARTSNVALIYYSGTIAQLGERNYLIPANLKGDKYSNIEFNAVPLDPLLYEMNKRKGVNFVFLNACKLNKKKIKRKYSRRIKKLCHGLSPIAEGKNILVTHAIQPEGTVFSHTKNEKTFAKALKKNLIRPNASIEQILKTLKQDVVLASKNYQHPWVENQKKSKFVFNVQKIPFKPKQAQLVKAASFIPKPLLLEKKPITNAAYTSLEKQLSTNPVAGRQIQDILKVSPNKNQPIPSGKKTHPSHHILKPTIKIKKNTAIKVLQKRLADFKCYKGRVDGIWGPLSKRAASNFKKNIKLKYLNAKPSPELYEAVLEFSGPVCGKPCADGSSRETTNGQCKAIQRTSINFTPIFMERPKYRKKITKRKKYRIYKTRTKKKRTRKYRTRVAKRTSDTFTWNDF